MKYKRIKIIIIVFVLAIPTTSFALFTIGGYDIGVQLKILAESIKHTLHLKEIIGFTKKQVKDIRKTLQIVKDVNRDINEMKDYNLHKLGDDVLNISGGNLNDNINDLSGYISDKGFLDKQGNGRIKNFIHYVWGEEPTDADSPVKMKLFANRYFAIKSFEDVNKSHDFTYNIRKLYSKVADDTRRASPGESSQISAKLQAVNALQLARLQDSQSNMMELQAINSMNRSYEAKEAQQQTVYIFGGIASVFDKIKEEHK